MKKSKKIKPSKPPAAGVSPKVTYKENPWGQDAPVLGAPLKDFLPSPKKLKKAKTRIVRDAREVALVQEDNQRLKKQAEKAGISPEALMGAIVRDYLHGKLVRPERH